MNGETTHYEYDTDAGASEGHRANRLMSYDLRRDRDNYPLERVEYEYALDGDAAGNVEQVMREVPIDAGEEPLFFDVFGTHFTYKKNGEVRIITQRHWSLVAGTHQGPTILKVREFAGDGRARNMMRDRSLTSPHDPLDATAVWTDYDGDLPTRSPKAV